jgi:glycosyltransferase involved in cell wall biosynthesis
VNQSEVAAYYAAADAVALVSDHEPLGLALIEGMAFGLPAIVSDHVGCVGATDAARLGVNALVFAAGDVTALASAIEELHADVHRYRRMSAESAAIAQSYTPAVAAERLAQAALRLRDLGPRFGSIGARQVSVYARR